MFHILVVGFNMTKAHNFVAHKGFHSKEVRYVNRPQHVERINNPSHIYILPDALKIRGYETILKELEQWRNIDPLIVYEVIAE